MKTKHLIVILCLQAIVAYFMWPNNVIFNPNWFSIIAFILCMVPLFFLILFYQGKKAFIWCGFSGMAMILPGLFFLTDMSYYPVTSYFIYALLAGIVFLIGGITGLIGSWITKYYRWAFILVVPALMESQEFIRVVLSESVWFSPLPGIVYAFPMSGFLPLVQMASITGIYGPGFLGFFITAIGVFIGFERILMWEQGRIWLNIPDHVQALNIRDRSKALGIGLIITVLMGSLIVLGNLDAAKYDSLQKQSKKSISPAFIQTNYDVSAEKIWNRTAEIRNARLIRSMVLEADQKGGEVLVFTENTVAGYLPESELLWRDLKSIFQEVSLPTIIGVITSSEENRNFNIWYHLDEQAKIQNFYIKRYMIPFGEYMPMRPIITGLTNLYNRLTSGEAAIKSLSVQNAEIYDLERGKQEKIFNIKDIKVSPKVCAEVAFSKYFRESAKKGAEIIICPTTSNWFRKPADYYQHVLNARLRAIEIRRWVGHVANMGGTTIIDALGVIRHETPFNKRSVLVAKMPAIQGDSYYVKHGDQFAGLCLLILLTFIGFSSYQYKKSRH